MNDGVIYRPAPSDGPLRQGEIVSGLVEVLAFAWDESAGRLQVKARKHPYAIVISQDCDLERDFEKRTSKESDHDRLLPNLLFCALHSAEEIRYNRTDLNSKTWALAKGNRYARYHFLSKITGESDLQGVGLGEMCCDFSLFFSLATEFVYKLLGNNKATQRRTVLDSPYKEHFALRFHAFHERIALPTPHVSEPVTQPPPQS